MTDITDQITALKTELAEARSNLHWANLEISRLVTVNMELEATIDRFTQKDQEQFDAVMATQPGAQQRCLEAIT